jgi:hypothetical protein
VASTLRELSGVCEAILGARDADSGPGPATGPETVIGQWLHAILLGQRDRRDQLARRMANPKSDIADDLAVAETACQLAVGRYFGPDCDVRAVTTFARQLREASGEDLGGGLLQTEAVIRAALGEPHIDLSGISSASRFRIHTVAVTFVSRSLRLDESAVGALLASAESDVIRLGRRPSLAVSSSS